MSTLHALALSSLMLTPQPAPREIQVAPPNLPRRVMAAITPERCIGSVKTLAAFGTRHTLSDATSQTRGIGAAREWIKSRFVSFGATPVDEAERGRPDRFHTYLEAFDVPPGPRLPEGGRVVNVVAVLPGKTAEPREGGAGGGRAEGKERRYYVVGHYDSRNGDGMDVTGDAPGANDDASGVAVVLEIARVLGEMAGGGGRGPLDSTVVFLCTAGEEQGLYGARYHVEAAAARGERIMGVLNNDIVGDPSAPPGVTATEDARHTVRVFSEGVPRNAPAEVMAQIRALSGENDSPSRQLARFIADVAEREGAPVRPMPVFRLDRFLRGGDHTPFLENGFPAVRFTEVDEDYSRQHQNVRDEPGPDGRMMKVGDLPEFVDAGYLADVTRLNAAALVHLANAPSPPGNARIITATLANTTTIRWDPSPEPDAAGYEIVWRPTTSGLWERARDVGNVTEFTIELNKDDWFFGVRAYDREGYRSPVAFPGAARE